MSTRASKAQQPGDDRNREKSGEPEKHAEDNLGGFPRDVCIKPTSRLHKQRVRLVREEGPHNRAQEFFDNACHSTLSHQAGKGFTAPAFQPPAVNRARPEASNGTSGAANGPTGKSLLKYRIKSQDPKLKIFLFTRISNQAYNTPIPFLLEGRIMTVTKRGMGRGGRGRCR
jgi:hypothetical protein